VSDCLRIGIVGTGYVARGLARHLVRQPDMKLTAVVTRRRIISITDFPVADVLVDSIDALIDRSDIVVEASGDPLHATVVVERCFEAGLPVVTMNTEFHVTVGSAFANRGLLTEAEGDQPGTLAALYEEVRDAGFHTRILGNIKGYLNHQPSLEDMLYWSARQGIGLDQTIAFTDGTKLQYEQALVANGLGADIACQGMLGYECDNVMEGACKLAQATGELGYPISDYVLCSSGPRGVFIVADHMPEERATLEYLGLGRDPPYTIMRNHHLVHLEIPRTIRRIASGGSVLLNNSTRPRVSIAAIAKRQIKAGTLINKAIGSLEFRGEAVRCSELPDHVPMGILQNTWILTDLGPGEYLAWDDVQPPEHSAVSLTRELASKACDPLADGEQTLSRMTRIA
jgi:predicted homoserine dehydrogenase-like protein